MIVPDTAFQVTAVFDVPVTMAVNCCVAPVCTEIELGETVTPIGAGGAVVVTVTVAVPDFVVSATLVAVTVTVPAEAGAVNNPEALIDPAEACQVTAVFDVPVIVAVNCCVPPVCTETELGETVALTVGGLLVTVTVAWPFLVGSVALVAVTVHVPEKLGAVYLPVLEMDPPFEVHVTAVVVVPPMLAVNC